MGEQLSFRCGWGGGLGPESDLEWRFIFQTRGGGIGGLGGGHRPEGTTLKSGPPLRGYRWREEVSLGPGERADDKSLPW